MKVKVKRGQRLIKNIKISLLVLYFAYILKDYKIIWYKFSPWCDGVSHTKRRSAAQRSSSHFGGRSKTHVRCKTFTCMEGFKYILAQMFSMLSWVELSCVKWRSMSQEVKDQIKISKFGYYAEWAEIFCRTRLRWAWHSC